MELHITPALALLREHHLLDHVSNLTDFTATSVSYDSRKVQPGTLFFCKGNFQPQYLASARENGAIAYVAEKEHPEGGDIPAIIVRDEQKAMALLGAAFYGYPQNDLFIIAITGTKGKTTTAYFADHILAKSTDKHIALFSTLDRVLGNQPGDKFKSDLTTPESLDLFHDMRVAVNNGMTHLVMEVSSQAYKKNRIYGLKYNVGIFLNISPDHIGRNEHPTFADYLHCKEQLLVNSEICLINAETANFTDVYYTAKATTQPENIYLFARRGAKVKLPAGVEVDFEYRNDLEDLHESEFELAALTDRAKKLQLDNRYTTSVPGDYNEGNAVAAIIASGLAGAKTADAVATLDHVHIRGRMEMINSQHHGTIYVDYAHNYASLKRLLAFLKRQTNAGKVTVVLGATGDKGISRRSGFGKALTEEQPDEVILTTDDPGYEDPMKIAREIDSYIDHDKVSNIQFEMDRETAIKMAIDESQNDDIVVLAGKGEDPYQKIKGQDTPYPTDVKIAQDYIDQLEK
ncbi:UDP-N-acetylmuramoyl-L-alanyl-D-glutamate--2,6-diaminopimelate ligase [Limosilactobacillus sp. STM2_1]|uniref:UDP-N-acetylmuramyl-tripeptide synthetase n=1 Tax=Limosilactobacillus rudii TaxID=2759755 RepID=A0A7W3UJ80_9LACO|nr:UDP-N-acetylmuramoyl-L-alanyl-D-glutamate--2,6-diaminopimelate ligase [Limosilactobacillus rudii]MBB1078467.1 UDP-N-acetylmuramoyl-L-alanyl-D-glutamate--2,6-diaminopimelate ligase [Limosilactobacillus rudii]MBB1096597.1 UDP-N-acetylmuramoyl-L-alanyl-D-glutamate--2,6-diaminopimelate ligase [Limosilactobacillus rudii]MCD7134207.1 UDP-N-acetylmuramoyl-L-alanyl-D-glutamate--2,6-diaminopimelate ligase [Limosilactobacillus rudii]